MTRKRQQRDTERVRSQTWSGKGPSLREKYEAYMLDHCWRYLEMKAVGWGGSDKDLRLERGIIRGIAMGLVIMTTSYPDKTEFVEAVKETERLWIKRAKKVRKQGDQPPRRVSAMMMHW